MPSAARPAPGVVFPRRVDTAGKGQLLPAGTSTVGLHEARPAPAVAPRDPPRSTVACLSANPEGGGYVAGGGTFDRVPLPTSLAISWWRTARGVQSVEDVIHEDSVRRRDAKEMVDSLDPWGHSPCAANALVAGNHESVQLFLQAVQLPPPRGYRPVC